MNTHANNTNRKFPTILNIVLLVLIVAAVVSFIYVNYVKDSELNSVRSDLAQCKEALDQVSADLASAQSELKQKSFVDSEIVENDKGGLITVSMNWYYYTDDTCITSPEETNPAGLVQDIFCELHKSSLISAFESQYSKLEFSKQVIVNSGSSTQQRVFYLVGEYYLCAPLSE